MRNCDSCDNILYKYQLSTMTYDIRTELNIIAGNFFFKADFKKTLKLKNGSEKKLLITDYNLDFMERVNRIFCNIDENFLFTPLNNNTVKEN